MPAFLPENVGIAYSEGLRPLQVQKKYFDQKLREVLVRIKNKGKAYTETMFLPLLITFPSILLEQPLILRFSFVTKMAKQSAWIWGGLM